MNPRIYIRNISDAVDSSELESMFSSVGEVTSAVIELKRINGVDYRVGYVQMATQEQCQDSILRFNGSKKDGFVLVVGEDKPHVPNPNFSLKKPGSSSKANRN